MYNGIINIYKEKGYTSFDVVARLRGMLHQKRIGHTGTLDPDAEGVLAVCLGRATKVCELLTDRDKEYEAVLLLGVETDTQDLSGRILRQGRVEATEQEIREAVLGFVGSYDQVPPMYSALKVGGRKLCDLARQGITVERKARRVQLHSIEILWMERADPAGQERVPDRLRVKLRVNCSKGTYIRTLCHDIGERLGCGGCMESLLRTRAAGFRVEEALRLSEVEALLSEGRIDEAIFPVERLFADVPEVRALEAAAKRIANGNRIPESLLQPHTEEAGRDQAKVRLYDSGGAFVGIFTYQKAGRDFKPLLLMDTRGNNYTRST